MAVPDGARFPGATPVHHNDGGIVESGIRIRADRVRQMMIDETHFGARLAEMMREAPEPSILVRHAGKRTRYVERVEVIQWKLAAGKTLYITQNHPMRG